MTIPHVNVLIATPGHSVMSQYLFSLINTTQHLNKEGISWAYLQRYASHVGDAREITIGGPDPQQIFDSRPLQGAVTYDKIIWIDSDIAWNIDDFMKLYNSDKDIISGAYLLAGGEVVAYPELAKPALRYEKVIEMTEPMKVHATGFGFLAVKQGVFESISRPWFQSVTVKQTNPETGEEYDFPLLGEDYSWCERAHRAGFDVWFDPTIRVTHHKTMQLTWEGPRS